MSRFEQRLTRLEQRTGMKSRERIIYLTPNLQGDKAKETPYAVKISSEVWAHVLGNSGPFTDEEIDRLKKTYAEHTPKSGKDTNEAKLLTKVRPGRPSMLILTTAGRSPTRKRFYQRLR